MTALLLAVIPIVLTALFAGQVAVTRTGRLRRDILANLDLLGRLPAEHPNRAALEARTGSWWVCGTAGLALAMTGDVLRCGSGAGASSWAL
jgi:hypothetical protein